MSNKIENHQLRFTNHSKIFLPAQVCTGFVAGLEEICCNQSDLNEAILLFTQFLEVQPELGGHSALPHARVDVEAIACKARSKYLSC